MNLITGKAGRLRISTRGILVIKRKYFMCNLNCTLGPVGRLSVKVQFWSCIKRMALTVIRNLA